MKNKIYSIIFITIFFAVLVQIERGKTDQRIMKLDSCSKFTIVKIISLRLRSSIYQAKYTFTTNDKFIENEEAIDYADFGEDLFFDLKQIQNKRFFVKYSCNDYSNHEVLWHISVPDTLKYIPKDGWSKIPYNLETNKKKVGFFYDLGMMGIKMLIMLSIVGMFYFGSFIIKKYFFDLR